MGQTIYLRTDAGFLPSTIGPCWGFCYEPKKQNPDQNEAQNRIFMAWQFLLRVSCFLSFSLTVSLRSWSVTFQWQFSAPLLREARLNMLGRFMWCICSKITLVPKRGASEHVNPEGTYVWNPCHLGGLSKLWSFGPGKRQFG